LEGGQACAEQITAIVHDGTPVVGHIGMLPQHLHEEGGFKLKGKTEAERLFLLAEARAVERAGGFAVVLELVQADVAAEITGAVAIPTIGIGSGEGCDGQILVFHDLVGYYPWFRPKHVHPEADLASEVTRATRAYIERVRRLPRLAHDK
jgi:3-methyl-2-oxobutanoate hydroxymethyltransferase